MEFFDHFQKVCLGIGQMSWNLKFGQIALRAIIVFFATLLMVRAGDKRLLSHKTAFDAVLGFLLASMLARAVNGSAAFWATLGGGFVLIGLHRLLGSITRRWHTLGDLVKGHANLVIKDGAILRETLLKHHLSEHDLAEDLRLNGNVESPDQVKLAYYERNGQISVVKKET